MSVTCGRKLCQNKYEKHWEYSTEVEEVGFHKLLDFISLFPLSSLASLLRIPKTDHWKWLMIKRKLKCIQHYPSFLTVQNWEINPQEKKNCKKLHRHLCIGSHQFDSSQCTAVTAIRCHSFVMACAHFNTWNLSPTFKNDLGLWNPELRDFEWGCRYGPDRQKDCQ